MAQFSFDFSAPQAAWQVPAQVRRLIDEGALFVVNHSGGKDSQAMLIRLHAVIPADQLLIVHADLPEVDWEGIRAVTLSAGDEVEIVGRHYTVRFPQKQDVCQYPSLSDPIHFDPAAR